MRLIYVSIIFLISCTYTPEVTLLVGGRVVNGQTEPGLYLSVMQEFGNRGICGLSHTSNPTKGPPFNGEFEIASDFGGCGMRFGGKRRVRKD